MALSESKIKALRELAARGVDGERDNAISILRKHGIPVQEPGKARAGTGTGTNPNFQRGRNEWEYEFNGFNFDAAQAAHDFGNVFDRMGRQYGWGDEYTFGRQSTARAAIIEGVDSLIDANVINVIAQKVFGPTKGKASYDLGKRILTFENLSPSQASEMETIYKRNLTAIQEAIIKAVFTVHLK